ncbi:MAG TPA: indole-3-glycerol phosphate synthase TrpC [Candidatus Eremiobacteraceae bacterium]|nr:indole-3-glycerol phosphate synthase TrpC [Candidatus Eremiobacteraceae bacterium]
MSHLDSIVALRRSDLAAEKRPGELERLQRAALLRTDRRDFEAAVLSGRPALIAEIKRASPSAGAIDGGCDAAATARAYEAGGAAALSVLTESRHFAGSFADLTRARAAVALPVLCKDFIVDEFQIWKAVARGADAVLLIAAVLCDRQLYSFVALSANLGVAALVEVHSSEEIARALAAGASMFGINNRDLHSFAVDVATAVRLRSTIPLDCPVVGESGYRTRADVHAAAEAGLDAVLVGEALMRAADRAATLRALRGDVAWSG